MSTDQQQLQQQHRLLTTSLLEIECDRLLVSLAHLERSVQELREAHAADPSDLEYKAAISENLVVIAKQRARVACLEDEIKRAKGQGAVDICHAQVAAVPVLDDAAPQPQPQSQPPQPSASGMDVDGQPHASPSCTQQAAAAGVDARAASQQQSQQPPGPATDGMWL